MKINSVINECDECEGKEVVVVYFVADGGGTVNLCHDCLTDAIELIEEY